jgi:hypothetical protein
VRKLAGTQITSAFDLISNEQEWRLQPKGKLC